MTASTEETTAISCGNSTLFVTYDKQGNVVNRVRLSRAFGIEKVPERKTA